MVKKTLTYRAKKNKLNIEVNMAFCTRLKEVRKSLKLKQKVMAEKLDIHYVTYNKYENGATEPAIDFMHTLYRNFNVNMNWLITGEGMMFVPEHEKVLNRLEDLQNDINMIKSMLTTKK